MTRREDTESEDRMTTTTTDPNARRTTARERAQEQVDAKTRKIKRLTEKAAALRDEADAIEEDVTQEKALLAYMSANPLLADPAQTSIDDVLDEEPLPEGGEPA